MNELAPIEKPRILICHVEELETSSVGSIEIFRFAIEAKIKDAHDNVRAIRKSSCGDGIDHELKVVRTMTDFLRIHLYLTCKYPYCSLPEAPPNAKRITKENVDTAPLVQWHLSHFVRHPVLHDDEMLWTFLAHETWSIDEIPPPPPKLATLPFTRRPTYENPYENIVRAHIRDSHVIIDAVKHTTNMLSSYSEANFSTMKESGELVALLSNVHDDEGLIPLSLRDHYHTISTCFKSMASISSTDDAEIMRDVRIFLYYMQSCMRGLNESLRVIEPIRLQYQDLSAKQKSLHEQKDKLVAEEAANAAPIRAPASGGGFSSFMKRNMFMCKRTQEDVINALTVVSENCFENHHLLQKKEAELRMCTEMLHYGIDNFYRIISDDILQFVKMLLRRQLQFNKAQIQHWTTIALTTASDESSSHS
eukprot:CFRG7206T1